MATINPELEVKELEVVTEDTSNTSWLCHLFFCFTGRGREKRVKHVMVWDCEESSFDKKNGKLK